MTIEDTKAADVHDLSDAALACRDMRHAWDWHQDVHIVENARGDVTMWTRELICLRCGSFAWDDFDSRMSKSRSRRYQYSEKYLMAKGTPRVSAAEARQEYMRRAGHGTPRRRASRTVKKKAAKVAA